MIKKKVKEIIWYNNIFLSIIIALILLISTLVTGVMGITCLIDGVYNKWLFIPALIMVLSFMLSIKIITKQKEIYDISESKYKYTIKTIQGKGYNTYYTNDYKIKDGVIYFDGNCANNFIVETND